MNSKRLLLALAIATTAAGRGDDSAQDNAQLDATAQTPEPTSDTAV